MKTSNCCEIINHRDLPKCETNHPGGPSSRIYLLFLENFIELVMFILCLKEIDKAILISEIKV